MGDTTLRELIYGKGAHVDPVACIEDISTDLAVRTGVGYPHSIWQIVEHMNYWMEYDLAKIAGKGQAYPDHAIESWPARPSPDTTATIVEQWQAATVCFRDLLTRLAQFAESDAAALERVVKNVGSPQSPREVTVHAMLYQVIAHNSYHAGQIALLRRQAGAWPPERGGDTW